MDEQQIWDNDIRVKDAYRKKEGLLTSAQIGEIRAKYGISQGDLCLLLVWGGKTITRYESHQVQDKEQAYIETAPSDIIQFKYAESLQI